MCELEIENMFSRTSKKMVMFCWKPFLDNNEDDHENRGKFKGLMWHKDLGRHACGEFSMAVMQANIVVEDQSQVESGPLSSVNLGPHGTFIGIYDGHGGPNASNFVNNNLFYNLQRFASEYEKMSIEVIKKAFLATDENFLAMVRKQWDQMPHIASQGSCCLVGVICNGHLYIANAGDSRVVLGRRSSIGLRATQLSTDHNAIMETERDELLSLHPDDPNIVVQKNKVWRVKGIIQVTRSIGDAYLKSSEFNKDPLAPKYRVTEPFFKPILRAEPSVSELKLQPEDQFLIFASDGLWEHLTNQQAVDFVRNNQRNGIAKKLVKEALHKAAKKREMRYSDLKKIEAGVRRHFHDDITVIVVFLDQLLVNRISFHGLPISIKGGGLSQG